MMMQVSANTVRLLVDAGAEDNSWLIVFAIALLVVGVAAFILGRGRKSGTDS